MAETIGEAMDEGWDILARCAWGWREGLKSVRECGWKHTLDIVTLVATRGRDFEATGSLELASNLATHSTTKMTKKYSRGDGLETSRRIAEARAAKRK